MTDRRIVFFSPDEHKAFNVLFGEITLVELAPRDGGPQDRLARPLEKIVHLFPSDDEALAFISRLNALGLFKGPPLPCGSVRVDLDGWLTIDDAKQLAEDPQKSVQETTDAREKPCSQEKLNLDDMRRLYQDRVAELQAKRLDLARQLQETDAALDQANGHVEKIDDLLARIDAIHREAAELCP